MSLFWHHLIFRRSRQTNALKRGLMNEQTENRLEVENVRTVPVIAHLVSLLRFMSSDSPRGIFSCTGSQEGQRYRCGRRVYP